MHSKLNPQQQKAVEYGQGPLLIVAGAGSGKTTTLVHRLAHLITSGTPAHHIILITFTNKAAEEMKTRAFSLLSTTSSTQFPQVIPRFVGTFHSLGAKILRDHAEFFKRSRFFTIFDEADSLQVTKNILKEFGVPARITPSLAHSLVSKAKNELETSESLESPFDRIYEAYEESLKAQNAFDFDDLIEKVVRLFTQNKSILDHYRNEFRHILVDEFQDINTSQYAILQLLAGNHKNINVVGDDAQSIYRFRGSDFRIFLRFEEDWPKAKVVFLEENYRSTKTIITAASHLIGHNTLQKKKELWTKNIDGVPITMLMAGDHETEAEWIASHIPKKLASGVASSVAIIYRTNAQSRALEQALIDRRIPYRIFGGLRFYDRQEIKDIVAVLRFAINPSDRVSLSRIMKAFPRRIHIPLLLGLPKAHTELSPKALIQWIITTSHYEAYIDRKFKNPDERRENIQELISFAEEFQSLPDFLERITLLQSSENPKSPLFENRSYPVVQLMTIHLAKGLEFDQVFVAGCEEGVLPHHRSIGSKDELEEERRLLYVAMTRAKQSLALTFAQIPSRFLYEIPPELTNFINLRDQRKFSLEEEDDIYID